MKPSSRARCVVTAALLAGIATVASARVASADEAALAGAESQRRVSTLTVIGVIIRDGGDALAILEDRITRKQNVYRVGAMIASGRITEILPDRIRFAFPDGIVDLRRTTGATDVAVAPAPAADPPPPATPQAVGFVPPNSDPDRRFQIVESAALDRFLGMPDIANLGVIRNQGGLQVGEVTSSSLLGLLGLRKGDIIRNVNGRTPGADASLSQVLQREIPSGMLRFQYQRDGRMDVRYLQVRP